MAFRTDESCAVITNLHPFDHEDTIYTEIFSGRTIAEILGEDACPTCAVYIDGHVIARDLWQQVVPMSGQYVHVTVFPQGGGNGSKWIRIVALVALVIVANVYGAALGEALGVSAAHAAAVGGSIIMSVGSLAIGALIPVPVPKFGSAGNTPFDHLQALTGTNNQAVPYGVIPCAVGTTRFFPGGFKVHVQHNQ